jgi:hypothetical protein
MSTLYHAAGTTNASFANSELRPQNRALYKLSLAFRINSDHLLRAGGGGCYFSLRTPVVFQGVKVDLSL